MSPDGHYVELRTAAYEHFRTHYGYDFNPNIQGNQIQNDDSGVPLIGVSPLEEISPIDICSKGDAGSHVQVIGVHYLLIACQDIDLLPSHSVDFGIDYLEATEAVYYQAFRTLFDGVHDEKFMHDIIITNLHGEVRDERLTDDELHTFCFEDSANPAMKYDHSSTDDKVLLSLWQQFVMMSYVKNEKTATTCHSDGTSELEILLYEQYLIYLATLSDVDTCGDTCSCEFDADKYLEDADYIFSIQQNEDFVLGGRTESGHLWLLYFIAFLCVPWTLRLIVNCLVLCRCNTSSIYQSDDNEVDIDPDTNELLMTNNWYSSPDILSPWNWNSTSPSLARFIYRRSHLWVLVVENILSSCMRYDVTPGDALKSLTSTLEMFLLHSCMLREDQWKIIILDTNLMAMIVNVIRSEVSEVEHDEFDVGIRGKCLDYCFAFTLKWLQQYRKLKQATPESLNRSEYADRNFAEIMKLRKHCLHDYGASDPNESDLSYLSLQKELKTLEIVNLHIKRRWKMLKASQECINCRKTRTDASDWKTCSACFVAVYCSKECAKCDWKIHKTYCRKFAEISIDCQSADCRAIIASINERVGTDKFQRTVMQPSHRKFSKTPYI